MTKSWGGPRGPRRCRCGSWWRLRWTGGYLAAQVSGQADGVHTFIDAGAQAYVFTFG